MESLFINMLGKSAEFCKIDPALKRPLLEEKKKLGERRNGNERKK